MDRDVMHASPNTSNSTNNGKTSTLTNGESLKRALDTSTTSLNNNQVVASKQSPTSLNTNRHVALGPSPHYDSSDQTIPSAISPSTELSGISTTASKKRGRGKTMGKALTKSFTTTRNKIKVIVDTHIGRLVTGEESAKLASAIGVITRDVIPVPIKWANVNEDKDLDLGFDHLKVHMNVNVNDP
ncbi:hypothetical protein GH714_012610 [Hevea brasiliensis]|uniref:Uncharacterized protein n=1 Tax=Hevea brasiliensis TaxID=3981 RepID=A0A6A6K846_HEVBR|nr:hypothetical protein GH714_012610 [Hevea brasiliensis]